MKLLHVIPGFEIRGGGGTRACAELCESLATLRHEVTVAHVDSSNENCFSPKGVDVKAFPPSTFRHYAYSPALREYLKREIPKVDLVHIHVTWQYPNIPTSRYCRQYHIPYVMQPHGNLHPWKMNHKALRKKLYWHIVEKSIFASAAFIHVESEADQEDIKHYCPDAETFVSPCGVYSEKFENRTNPGYIKKKWPVFKDKKCLLYLARVDVNKGIHLLLKAYSKLLMSNSDYNLLIVGPDYYGTTDKMKSLSRKVGIENRVIWAGMVSDQERIWIMQDCDIYVLPSMSENFAISVLEAMFCSKPILTTTSTPWKELQLHNAGIVTHPTVDGIYRGLMRMLSLDYDALNQLGLNAYLLAKLKYEWSTIAKSLVGEYESVIKSK